MADGELDGAGGLVDEHPEAVGVPGGAGAGGRGERGGVAVSHFEDGGGAAERAESGERLVVPSGRRHGGNEGRRAPEGGGEGSRREGVDGDPRPLAGGQARAESASRR